MPRIFTHQNPDLDAILSVCMLWHYADAFRGAKVVLVPANWDGASLGYGDIAVDLEAGGHGIKGVVDDDGTVHSCFAALMKSSAPAEDIGSNALLSSLFS